MATFDIKIPFTIQRRSVNKYDDLMEDLRPRSMALQITVEATDLAEAETKFKERFASRWRRE